MDIDKLFQDEQNDNLNQLLGLYEENEAVISYFKNMNNAIQKTIKNGDIDKIKRTAKKLSKNIQALSSLKFEIYDLDVKIPDSLQNDWHKNIYYITNEMSIGEVDTFLSKTASLKKQISNEIERIKISEERKRKLEEIRLEQEREQVLAAERKKRKEQERKLKLEEEKINKEEKELKRVYKKVTDQSGLKDFPNILKEIQEVKNSNSTKDQISFFNKLKKGIDNSDIILITFKYSLLKNHLLNIDISKDFKNSIENEKILKDILKGFTEIDKVFYKIHIYELRNSNLIEKIFDYHIQIGFEDRYIFSSRIFYEYKIGHLYFLLKHIEAFTLEKIFYKEYDYDIFRSIKKDFKKNSFKAWKNLVSKGNFDKFLGHNKNIKGQYF